MDLYVAKASEFADGDRRIVKHNDKEIGVFRWAGEFYAYSNYCVHQGGPACEGLVIHQVEQIVDDARQWHGFRFSDDHINFVCPWHGWEYDLKTGEFVGNRKLSLQRYAIRKNGEDIYVVVN